MEEVELQVEEQSEEGASIFENGQSSQVFLQQSSLQPVVDWDSIKRNYHS